VNERSRIKHEVEEQKVGEDGEQEWEKGDVGTVRVGDEAGKREYGREFEDADLDRLDRRRQREGQGSERADIVEKSELDDQRCCFRDGGVGEEVGSQPDSTQDSVLERKGRARAEKTLSDKLDTH
jgi:hypothetical protein